jgi:hypothetical protein
MIYTMLTEKTPVPPCPFCGGNFKFYTKGNDFTRMRSITAKCEKCRVQLTNGAIDNDMNGLYKKTVEMLNRRADQL